MNVETVVTLPEDLKAVLDRRAASASERARQLVGRRRAVLDRRAASPSERDELVAAALRAYFAWPRPGEDSADLAVINAHADELNAEAEDALSYQVPL